MDSGATISPSKWWRCQFRNARRRLAKLLADRARRPAIVYATSRKQAETLAEQLADRRACARPLITRVSIAETRERVQTAFQPGELEVVVATIAFGMGIDKADIRTVIHAGLPGTLEGYYQEIGRAGRDGKPSRTFLMHSYADQRTHDFFLNRDYPPAGTWHEMFRRAEPDAAAVMNCARTSKLSEEEFDKALEKLEIHGGARVDFGGNVARGRPAGKRPTRSRSSIARADRKVLRFTDRSNAGWARWCATSATRRMRARCGRCDVCDPAGAELRLFRRATAWERQRVQDIVEALRGVAYKTVKQLREEFSWSDASSRDQFEELLSAAIRAGLVEVGGSVRVQKGWAGDSLSAHQPDP